MRFRARHITTGRQEKNDLHFPDSVWKICPVRKERILDIETLRKAADVLGVLTDHLRTMPEEIQEDICQAMKQYEACDELSTHKQYEEIEKLWRKGTLILGMHEIAENTGMEISSLMQLSENEKLNLMYEYAIGTDKNELARMVNKR